MIVSANSLIIGNIYSCHWKRQHRLIQFVAKYNDHGERCLFLLPKNANGGTINWDSIPSCIRPDRSICLQYDRLYMLFENFTSLANQGFSCEIGEWIP